MDPRVPVIVGPVPTPQPWPPGHIPVRVDQPGPDLVLDPVGHDCRVGVGVDARTEERSRPRQQRTGLGGKEVDDRIGDLWQASMRVEGRKTVGRNPPETLLADRPDAVDDRIEETALPFSALGQDQMVQGMPAREVHVLKPRTVATAPEIQKGRCPYRCPVIVVPRLTLSNEFPTLGLGKCAPRLAVFRGWERLPVARE
ncbi:MAG: hypothetical protein EBT00_13425 [Proteobacteria bacterium]|nr:hypothetical protein [Pseudomonadota bacterium]